MKKLVGKRPYAQLFLAYAPEPGQSVRLNDQKEDDQSAEHHVLDVGCRVNAQCQPEHVGDIGKQHRYKNHEGGPKETAHDGTQPANNDNEEQLQGTIQIECQGLPGAQVNIGPQGASDSDNEGADRKGRELGVNRSYADDRRGDVHVANCHPLATYGATHEVLGQQGEDSDEYQHE